MKTRRNDIPIIRRFVRPVAWGLLVGAVLCVVLLLVCSLILATQDIPQAAVTPLALVAAAAGALCGGFVAARIANENGWLLGAICGCLLYVLIALAGLIFLQGVQGEAVLLKLAVLVACGAVGGILGVNLRRRHR